MSAARITLPQPRTQQPPSNAMWRIDPGASALSRAPISVTATQHLGARCGVTTLFRDVVARQRDDVWFQPVCRVDGALDLFAVGKRAVMNVRKLNYAESVKRFGKTIQVDAFMLDGEHVRLGQRGACDVRQAESQGT